MESNFGYLMDELEEFIEERVLPILCPTEPQRLAEHSVDPLDAKKAVVLSTIEEAVSWAEKMVEEKGKHVVSGLDTCGSYLG